MPPSGGSGRWRRVLVVVGLFLVLLASVALGAAAFVLITLSTSGRL